MGLAWEPGNDKQTMYFVFIIKTTHKSVSRGNNKITRKEMSKLFSWDYLNIRRIKKNDDEIKKKMMDFDYCEEYLTSISNKILLW